MNLLYYFINALVTYMYDMCVYFLFYQISTEQTSQLGAKASYMRKLLSIVKTKSETQAVDITMKFTLSALWNLTGIKVLSNSCSLPG